jgi:acetate kinase
VRRHRVPRSGSVDPGLLLWLIEHEGVTPADFADGLEHRSGLVALAGTGDMREILARVAAGDGDACAALDVYVRGLRAGIAAMAAAMNGLDVLVREDLEMARQVRALVGR